MFSSKGRRRALDEEDNEKKGSFLGKLNKPLFSSKGKHKEHLSIQGVQIKSDRQEDFDDEEKSTAKGSFLTKLNKPLFSKNSGSDDMPAKSGNRSLFAKKGSGAASQPVTRMHAPYTMFGKQHAITAKYAFFALGNTNIIARSVDVAASVQNDEDIEGLVSYELQQYLDIDPTSYVIQFQEQESNSAFPLDEDTRSLMVYAVPKGVVEQYLGLAENLKLTPYVFDLQSNTFEKWLERVQAVNNRAKKLTKENVGMVHLSKSFIGVYLYSEGKFVTSNYLNRGYKDILSYADDASLLQKLPAVASDDLDTGLLKRALDEWVADAKNHILNTENFFSGSTGLNIDSFYVFGDQDICWQLAAILKQSMNREFISIDNVDYENVLWEGSAEFNAEFIPATAMLIRRAN